MLRRATLLLVPLAIAACRGSGGADAANQAAPAEDNAAAPAAGAQTELQERAMLALGATIPEIATARFISLRPGAGRAICGQVSLPGPGGTWSPARPFVVTPEGAAAVSATPTVAWNDPRDPFPEPYGIWCASPEELQAVQSRPNGFIPPPGDTPVELPADNAVSEPDLGVPPDFAGEPAPPPEPAPRPRRPVPPRDPNDDSFFNTVLPPD
jgi:hypothetical protein